MKIAVVMISMNEELAIEKVMADIRKELQNPQVLLVDSSTDSTPELAEKMGATVIRQYPPAGYGNAMMLALKSASELADIVVTMDCDGTYPAEYIKILAEEIMNGCDIVDGCRLFKKPENMPWINYFGNMFVSSIASILYLKIIPDLHSGMRAYRSTLFNEVHFNPKGAALPVELLLKPITLGYKVKLMQIPYRIRLGESTMNPYETIKMSLVRIFNSRFNSVGNRI